MLRFRFFIAAFFALSPLPVLADSWDSLASISAEPTARYVCYGNADGKNITCDSTAPYVDATGKVGIGTASPAGFVEIKATGQNTPLVVSNTLTGTENTAFSLL